MHGAINFWPFEWRNSKFTSDVSAYFDIRKKTSIKKPISRRDLKSFANSICIICTITPVYPSPDMFLKDEESTHLSPCLSKFIWANISVWSPNLAILRYENLSRLVKFPNPIPEHHNLDFVCLFVFSATTPPPQWARASSLTRFLDHTQRRITVGRTPLDEWSARRRDLYLTTHNTHNRQTSMPPVGFEPTIPASERPQTYALDRAATETGYNLKYMSLYFMHSFAYMCNLVPLPKGEI